MVVYAGLSFVQALSTADVLVALGFRTLRVLVLYSPIILSETPGYCWSASYVRQHFFFPTTI